jgi:hypothetical protein
MSPSDLTSIDNLALTLQKSSELDNSNTGSDAALGLASYWLNKCLSEHERCRGMGSPSSSTFLPTRLLDVGRGTIRLIETAHESMNREADRRYIALSHCWGKTSIIRTLNENYENHLIEIRTSSLSQTFKDAVETTRKIGFRYIWIDSLCIIQNNKGDWSAEAATMCDVYRNAVLTISAAHAAGGDVGCFEKRDGLLQFPFFVSVPLPGSGCTKSSSEGIAQNARVLFTTYGRRIGLGGPEPPIYGRAWVLQEQLLPTRMLIFDGPQLRWECLVMHGSESDPQSGMSRHIGHQKVIRMGITNDTEFFDLVEPEYEKEFAHRVQYQFWCSAVMDYTHRGMTNPLDRLVAIDGIANALGQKTKHKYLAGMWAPNLWMGLLWSIPHTSEFTPTTMGAFNIEENVHIRHDTPIAPSWSWVSVTAPVVYPVPTIIALEPICKVLTSQVAGSPEKQSGKLEIRGHIRTAYINSIYPYAIREAAKAHPTMTCEKPTGGFDLFTYRGQIFHPHDFFIVWSGDDTPGSRKFTSSHWRLVRGTWRPDDVLDPKRPITFLAIAQQNSGSKEGSLLPSHENQDPLVTYALGLVPTGKVKGEYTRVGYAVWKDCSWYGYKCGHEEKIIGRAEGWRETLAGNAFRSWGSGEVDGKGLHGHDFRADRIPSTEAYHKNIHFKEETIVIV